MLCAFFDVKPGGGGGGGGGCGAEATTGPKFKVRGRSKKPAPKAAAVDKAADVRPSESSTTVMHAQFEALPGERNVPKAYEADEAYELSDDDAVPDNEQWDYVRQDADMEEAFEEDAESELADDDMSHVSDASELASSVDDTKISGGLLRTRARLAAADQRGVYAGPQLCLEDDAFLD